MIFLFTVFINVTFAQITCTHPQVCNLVNYVSEKKLEFNNPIESNIDPHQYDPTTKIIKQLISAQFLVTAPIDLQPWMSAVLKERLKEKKPTLVLSNLKTQKYLTDKANTTAHFWMYPEILCFNLDQVKFFLKSNGFPLKEVDCKSMIKPKASLEKYTFILTHDALEPLFLNFRSKTITLKTSNHHAEILPTTIKQIENLPNHTNIIWLVEKNIFNTATIIKKYRKPLQQMINFDLDGTIGEVPFKRYETLLEQLAL